MSKFLITGGAGFIGGNFCHYMVSKYPNDEFYCLDTLTYAGSLVTLDSILSAPNFKFVYENICNKYA
ncbi:MAG: GDP-mannose 4,6-dehydratase, partial [Anaeroplasmataceae bacterium]|nr:GDP-mannose 4,6-dehydratase [Anaeroplasmataceae bacterium]